MDPLTLRRFLEKVEYEPNSGCWLWRGSGNAGYGQLRIAGNLKLAHRLAYEHWVDPLPIVGPLRDRCREVCVLHRCDVSWCVNPDHLFLGTRADNTNDMWRKGRGRCRGNAERPGELHPLAKLTEVQIREIRRKAAENVPTVVLSKMYGVQRGQIGKIVRGVAWSHIS